MELHNECRSRRLRSGRASSSTSESEDWDIEKFSVMEKLGEEKKSWMLDVDGV